MTKKIIRFFDKLEDKMRGELSHYPIFYAFLGGVGVVLFWRGVWHTTDFITLVIFGEVDFTIFNIIDGPLSLVVGSVMLLITGVFVSAFIGGRLIVTGLYGEKKLTEKTKEEIETEEAQIQKIQVSIDKLDEKISQIESEITHSK